MEFTQKLKQERDNIQAQKKRDLLEVAKIAGLGDRLKPKVNVNDDEVGYGKFDDAFDDMEDNDSLDVRVY